jgi:para-aminobenzoate synthetase component 1
MSAVEVRKALAWRDPLSIACGLRDAAGLICLLTGGDRAGRSLVAAEPSPCAEHDTGGRVFAALGDAPGPGHRIGLASYDAGARAATGARPRVWPDLTVATYPAVLLFDSEARSVEAVGFGRERAEAEARCAQAETWWACAETPRLPDPPSTEPAVEMADAAYRAAVADVVDRIAAGELFQANIARSWSGRLTPGAEPFDVFVRLSLTTAAPYAACWNTGARAVVSNSPELFVSMDAATRRVETRPIKGTRPRGPTPDQDEALSHDLFASAKDRAENLMIVDLMRNDLARVCQPGSVRVEALFDLESHPTVHHLVSRVSGRANDGIGASELLEATFPPGSITGAPKHQAMKVIAAHEPPRGPWCGTLFHVEPSGSVQASVLIRTIGLIRDAAGWAWSASAGAGIVADSDPESERIETEVKFEALRRALCGPDR